MNSENPPTKRDLIGLSPDDAQLLDRLLAGEAVDGPRAERLRGLLSLLDRWEVADAPQGLPGRTVAEVLGADPASLSAEDGEALDALMSLRQQGMAQGPMPAGSRERAQRVSEVLSVLDHMPDEPVPEGLANKTLWMIERDRAEQRRLSAMSITPGDKGRGGFSIRQLVATAALLLMAVSVLLPILDKGRRDAMIAQCSANLAGLGIDLTRTSASDQPTPSARLAPNYDPGNDRGYASNPNPRPNPQLGPSIAEAPTLKLTEPDVPPTRVRLIYLLDNGYVHANNLVCPSAGDYNGRTAGYFSGQNPIVGGPGMHARGLMPVFADTNPLYRLGANGKLVRNTDVQALTQSANHNGAGQNMLFNDGSVQWTVSPAINRGRNNRFDNVWLFQPQDDADDDPDAFLTP